jgi:hypothetical protein
MRLMVVLRPGVSRPSVLLSHIPGTSQTLRCKKPICSNSFYQRVLSVPMISPLGPWWEPLGLNIGRESITICETK